MVPKPRISIVIVALCPVLICSCSTPAPELPLPAAPIAQDVSPLAPLVEEAATLVIEHPFPPADRSSVKAYLTPAKECPTSCSAEGAKLRERFVSRLEAADRLHFITPPSEPVVETVEIAADRLAARVASIRKLGACYLFDLTITPPGNAAENRASVTVEVTDTGTGLTVLRKVAAAEAPMASQE